LSSDGRLWTHSLATRGKATSAELPAERIRSSMEPADQSMARGCFPSLLQPPPLNGATRSRMPVMILWGVHRLLKRNRLLLQLSLYVLLGVTLTGLLSAAIFAIFRNSYILGIEDSAKEQVLQSYHTCEAVLLSSYEYYYNLFSSSVEILNSLYSRHFLPMELVNINKRLSDLVLSNPLRLVHSAYVINPEADLVFSSKTTTKRLSDFPDQGVFADIADLGKGRGITIVRRTLPPFVPDKEEALEALSIIYSSETQASSTPPAMVINLDLNVLEGLLAGVSNIPSSALAVLDRSGDWIIDPPNEPDILIPGWNGDLSRYVDSSAQDGKVLSARTQGVIAAFVYSERLRWTFVRLLRYTDLVAGMNNATRSALVVTCVFLSLSLIVSLFFLASVYWPIRYLVLSIRRQLSFDASDLSEYGILADTISSLLARVDLLKRSLAHYIPTKRNDTLRRILRGEVSESRFYERDFRVLDIQLQWPFFMVCVFLIDSFWKLRQSRPKSVISQLRLDMVGIGKELLGNLGCELLDVFDDHVAAIFNYRRIDQADEQDIKRCLGHVQEVILHRLGISVTIGIGTVVQGLSNISESYDSASVAARYRLLRGKGAIIHHSEIHAAAHDTESYPSAKEQQLLDSLRLGHFEKATVLLDAILGRLRSLRHSEATSRLSRLSSSCIDLLNTFRDTETESTEPSAIGETLVEWETLEEIKEWFLKVFGLIHGKIDEEKNARPDVILRNIVEHIQTGYQDANLSVESLAGKAGISTNYLRALFKRHRNQSISSFIDEVRFERAKRLLIETELPAKVISQRVGFYNSGYFYTNFRKTTGLSPMEYRRRNRREA
jgi:two-component system response regulator YesN